MVWRPFEEQLGNEVKKLYRKALIFCFPFSTILFLAGAALLSSLHAPHIFPNLIYRFFKLSYLYCGHPLFSLNLLLHLIIK